jgi:Cu(I)/Ag(I) efflux system membrane protein CusA/SilA
MLVYLNHEYQALMDRCKEGGTLPSAEMLTEAVLHGAGLRVRPVMMTTATIIFGLLPVLYGSGTGSEVMSRIAAPMVGGMVSAIILTLLILPAIYLIWRKQQLKYLAVVA